MNNASMVKKGNAFKMPLRARLKYMFTGYKTQIFIDSIRKKAPICILAFLITLTVIYILLHPIDKIKLRYFITQSFTIETISKRTIKNYGHTSKFYETSSEIHIDGDWVEYNGQYYNLVNGEVYRCFKDSSGKWQKELYNTDVNSSTYAKLLDKSNYERDKKNPFVWKLKEDACKEIMGSYNVYIKRYQGAIAIVCESKRDREIEKYICFWEFGTTNIEFPWDE